MTSAAVWPDWAIFNVLGEKISYKSRRKCSENFLGYFENIILK